MPLLLHKSLLGLILGVYNIDIGLQPLQR